ncbi:polyketide cyclase/dehydrase [Natrialba hulunbeirensis JCM 10989]|uniref:Polyketide cyclase/dehydrase n=1 Tax=Natrialba hulunbeirensis JCM 10989 TaxID=1227493 RepID=M0A5F2_9EURY|nr:SRPBCC domain-containing protein [Natrialba hulunbeirensis]ELY93804.1 polyketide cyclase/dehydrase [Natrialba hulunbeirensis JCM 10989]
MKQIEVFEEIDAPPDVVWDVLLEFERYPEWNPFVQSIEGTPVEGEQLRVRIQPPGGRGMTFKPAIVALEEGRRLAWFGRLVVPFAFDGYHEFRVEPIDRAQRTRFLQRETFRGALVPVLANQDRLERGFRSMNEAIKERAEARVAASS